MGKSSTAYLLSQASLGGIGGQIGSPIGACGSDSDGGDAIVGTIVYVPCGNGVQAIRTSPLSTQWQTSSWGTRTTHPRRWPRLVDRRRQRSTASTPWSGTTVEQVPTGGEAHHFPTPSVGEGLLLAPSTDQIYAYSGCAGLPGPPSPPPPAPPNSSYWLSVSRTAASSPSATPASTGRPAASG